MVKGTPATEKVPERRGWSGKSWEYAEAFSWSLLIHQLWTGDPETKCLATKLIFQESEEKDESFASTTSYVYCNEKTINSLDITQKTQIGNNPRLNTRREMRSRRLGERGKIGTKNWEIRAKSNQVPSRRGRMIQTKSLEFHDNPVQLGSQRWNRLIEITTKSCCDSRNAWF